MNNLPLVVTTHSFVVVAVFHYKEEESSRGRSKIARCDQDPQSSLEDGVSSDSLALATRSALTGLRHRVAVLQARAVLARQSHVTLADAGWLAAGARGLEPANQIPEAALGATLAAALLEVRKGVEVAAGGPLGVAEPEVTYAVLEDGEDGARGAVSADGRVGLQHRCTATRDSLTYTFK